MPVGVMYQPPTWRRVDCSHRMAGSSTLIDERLTTNAKPRARNIPASEAMNGCTSKNCTSTAISSPIPAPLRIITGMTTPVGTPSLSSRAHMMPVNARTDPTDRSMPPVRITKVMPTARMSRYALSSSSDEIRRGVRKLPKYSCAPTNMMMRMASAAKTGIQEARRFTNTFRRPESAPAVESLLIGVLVTMPPPRRDGGQTWSGWTAPFRVG